MQLLGLPSEAVGAIVEILLMDIGIRKALTLRGVCKLFAYHIEDAIFSLPTFEDADDLCPAHCRQDPRMSKNIVRRLIIQKMRSENAESRSLINEIVSTVQYLRSCCHTSNIELAEALAAGCADVLPVRDISRGLAQNSYRETCQTLPENSLLAAICLNDSALCDAALSLCASSSIMTRFFGDSLSAAARKGRDQILRRMLENPSRCDSASAEQLFRHRQSIALNEAAANGHEATVQLLLDKGDVLTQGDVVNHATKTALLSYQENVARMLASRDCEHLTYDTDLLRAAATCNSTYFLQAVLNHAEAAEMELGLVLALEDSCRNGHLLVAELLLSRYGLQGPMVLSGSFFWAARQGGPDILRLLFSTSADCRISALVDALAGAASAGSSIDSGTLDEISWQAGRQIEREDLASFAEIVEEVMTYPRSPCTTGGSQPVQRSPYLTASDLGHADETPSLGTGRATTVSIVPTLQVPQSSDAIDDSGEDLFESLKEACTKGDIRSAIRLFDLCIKLDIGGLTRAFHTSVSAAAKHNRPGILAYMLHKFPGFLPVEAAIASESLASFQILLDHGWDINKTLNRLRPPPLGLLIQREYFVKWLIDNGADPNARGDWDITPLSAAVLKASPSTIDLLMKNGGDIRKGQLLHFAAQRQLDDAIGILDWLLALGLPVHAIHYAEDARSWMENSKFGMGTPLHIATERGHTYIVSFLLERGANPDLPDSIGRSARQLAQQNGWTKIFHGF